MTSTGNITCTASNYLGNDSVIQAIFLTGKILDYLCKLYPRLYVNIFLRCSSWIWNYWSNKKSDNW